MQNPTYQPVFTLHTIFNIIDLPPHLLDNFLNQKARRTDLRLCCQAFSTVSPDRKSTQLPAATTAMNAAWDRVISTDLSRDRRRPGETAARPAIDCVNLQYNDPRLIAEVLKDLWVGGDDEKFEAMLRAFEPHVDCTASFARCMAQLVAESIDMHGHRAVVRGVSASVVFRSTEVIDAEVKRHVEKPCSPFNERFYNRLVFFATLYSKGVAFPDDYTQVFISLAQTKRSCVCLLKAIHLIAGSGDRRVVEALLKNGVDPILDHLLRADRRGKRDWELKGDKAAIAMHKQTIERIQSWQSV
ncbi:unnamed protein product [Peniophora sp. CBMAI 1063]|nr:unnamed protein product [Peniophora sp. CBMAI 1063]